MVPVKTSVRPSTIHGLGCFAEEPIKKGQVVWTFDPACDIEVKVEDLSGIPAAVREFLLDLGFVELVDGHEVLILCRGHGNYINHSDTPNLLDLEDNVAARDIEAGEELTCNYWLFDLDAARKLGGRR